MGDALRLDLSSANGASLLGAIQTPQGTAVDLAGDVLFDCNKARPAELAVLITRTQPMVGGSWATPTA